MSKIESKIIFTAKMIDVDDYRINYYQNKPVRELELVMKLIRSIDNAINAETIGESGFNVIFRMNTGEYWEDRELRFRYADGIYNWMMTFDKGETRMQFDEIAKVLALIYFSNLIRAVNVEESLTLILVPLP